MTSTQSPTWSVYDGLWACAADDAEATPLPLVADPLPSESLKGCGLKKKELLFKGAQGAVYAAYDPFLRDAAAESHTDGENEPTSKGRLVALKRLFIQPNDFGARGVAETVLREATLLRYIAGKQRQQQQQQRGDPTAQVVRLHRVVEAPYHELCLEMEYCELDLSRIAIRDNRKRNGGCVLANAWGFPGVDTRENEATEQPSASSSGGQEKLSQQVIKCVLKRILSIVDFLHEDCHILHRDLKPSNILVTRDGNLRLSDFGSARFMKPVSEGKGDRMQTPAIDNGTYTPSAMRTTQLYQAPECLLGSRDYNASMEVWSIGVVFAELLRQTHLFSGDSDLRVLSAIWKLLGAPPSDGETLAGNERDGGGVALEGAAASPAQPTFPHKFNESVVSPEGYDLLCRMLKIRPHERITIREALAHPFLSSLTADEDAKAFHEWQNAVEAAATAAEKSVSVRMQPLPSYMDDELLMGTAAFGGGGLELMPPFAHAGDLRVGLGLELADVSSTEDEEASEDSDPPVLQLIH